MCMVSAVMPQIQDAINPFWQQLNTYPQSAPDPRIAALAKDVQDVLARLDRIDKALGLRDCAVEAAAKEEFMRKLNDLAESAKAL